MRPVAWCSGPQPGFVAGLLGICGLVSTSLWFRPLPCRVLEEKAREHEIPDLTSLYGSDMFRQCGFAYDRTANVITYTSV